LGAADLGDAVRRRVDGVIGRGHRLNEHRCDSDGVTVGGLIRSAARMFGVAVRKNVFAASPSSVGELETSTTISASVRASARPSPVIVFTPVLGVAATASCSRH
jgi:hypothetical protein